MEIKNIKITKCSLNLGELHSLTDYEHINPVFECQDEDGSLFTASMRLHISEPLDGLIFADPRKFADEGIGVNSAGSMVIARKESFKDSLPEKIFLDEHFLKDVQLYRIDIHSLIEALLNGYNFEQEQIQYLNDKNKKPEIAFTCHDPNIIGGGNLILFRLINWLDALGIKTTVYSCGIPPTWTRVNSRFKCYKTYKEMFKSIEERIVVVYSMWHIEPVLKSNPKGKLIYHLRQIYEPYHYGSDYETMLSHKYAIELLETLPIGLITISPHLEEYYKKYHNLDSHLVTNGVDPSVFYPTKKNKLNPKEYSIISVGCPDHFVKGNKELGKALKKLALRRKDLILKWNILTGVQGRINLEKIPANLIINQITGQSQIQMRKHYSDSDIFVNPSLYEGFGLPSIEAMLCGTPVVQADNKGLDFIIDCKNDSLLVPVNDADKLADAIEKLINDPELYRKLRNGGYNKALKYTTNRQFEMFAAAFQKILDLNFDEKKIGTIKNSLRNDFQDSPEPDSVISEEKKYNPLVSVVIPSYNQADYLREALNSLLAQTYTNWEAVVINDGSKDHTEDVMKEYAERDSRIRTFTKINGGITSALNAGLEKARGEFFCWLSSDDLFYPDKLELQVKAYENLDENYALVYGSFDILNESNISKELQKQPFAAPLINGCEFPEAFKFDFIDGCTIMIRMNVMRELKGFNPGIVHSQDMELWIRIASRGYRFLLLPNKLTIRRVHVAQSSTSNMIHCRYDAAWMINFYLNHYHLLEVYRYVNLFSEKGIKDFVEHFVSRTFDTEANVNNPLLQEKYWNWFREGIKALPVHIQNILLRNCLIYFLQNQKITYKIKYYIEQCINELQKDRIFIPRAVDFSPEGRDFRESDRSKDFFADELFEYGLNLLVNNNTPLFAQELYFHNTNKLVDTPFKLAHSAFRYLSQFNNPYRENVTPLAGLDKIPGSPKEAMVLFVRFAFPSITQKIDRQISGQDPDNFINSVENYIQQLEPNEKTILRKVCSNNPSVPILYYWNGILLSSENKINDALEEAWKIFGYNLSELHKSVFEKIFNWAKNTGDVEKAYYLSVICSRLDPDSEIAGQKETLLRQFSAETRLLPQLKPVYRENSNLNQVVINDCKVIPRQDGNYKLSFRCTTPHNKVINVEGLLPYKPYLDPKIVTDMDSGKEYLVPPDQIYNYWANGYNFFETLENELSERLANNNIVSVAFISPYTASVNGGTLVALRLADWLYELGIKVSVYSTGPAPIWHQLKCNFVSIKDRNELYASIREDIVITHSVLEIPDVLRICSKKRIYHLAQVIEDFHYHGHDYKSLMMQKGVFELLHSLPVGRISVSKHIHKYLSKQYKQNSYLVENGVDLLNFSPGNKKIPSNEITISTVGNLKRILKGTDDVIDAVEMLAQKHPEYKFNLIVITNGSKELDKALDYRTYKYNLVIVNELSQKDMHEIYLKSDIYINASWYEGFGLPTLEAMACGVPVLQADNKGLDGVILNGRDCIIFQPADPADLCQKIESLLGNKEKINRLIEEGFLTASKYSLVTHFNTFINAFEKILIHKFNGEKVKRLRDTISSGDYSRKLSEAKNLLDPKISVIIPVDKNSIGLEESLNSLLSQTYENWEACIVYNQTSAANISVARNSSKIHGKLKNVRCSSSNYADLLNQGLRNLDGEWITILKPGIIYSKNRFKSMINNIELNPDEKIFYTDYHFKEKSDSNTAIDLDSIKKIPFQNFQLFGLISNNHIKDFTLTINAKLVAELGGFEDKYNSASVQNMLLKAGKKYNQVFLINNSCTYSDKHLKNFENNDDLKKSLEDFLKNTSMEEIFPILAFSNQNEIKKIAAAVLEEINSKDSLLHEEPLNNLFLQSIKIWTKTLKNKDLASALGNYLKYNKEFKFRNNGIYYKFNVDIIKRFFDSSAVSQKTAPQKIESSPIFTGNPVVSIILVTFNQLEYTLKCMESIRKFTKVPYEIIVVDNASSDNTCMSLRGMNNIKVIENKENRGFPAAVNQGIVASKGKYVLLLNNDTVVTERYLDRMIDIIEADSPTGIVGPISNNVSGIQLDKESAYSSIDNMHGYAEHVRSKNAGKYFAFPRVAFLCTLIKKEVFEKIGGLDERFSPGNFEDDDFCLRAQLAGYKTVIAQDVFIHHFGSKSFKAEGVEQYAERLKINKQKFVEKWGADPEEIWLKGQKIKDRDIRYPLDKDIFKESFERVQIHVKENEYDLAAEEILRSLQNYPEKSDIKFIDLLNLAGNIFMMTADYERSHLFFEEALKIDPSSSHACTGLGELFFISKMYNESKTMFEWGVKNNPANKAAAEGLAKVSRILECEAPDLSLNLFQGNV